jgi:signal transduction histidine kinase
MSSKEYVPRDLVRAKAEERVTAGLLALEMVHEIRNPLEALSHLIYLGLEKADEPETVRQYLRLAQEQTAALGEISSNILGFARSSRLPKSTCLVALVEAALRVHRKGLEKKTIQLVKSLPDDLSAAVHSGEILQVISNLVADALDALPVGGTLCVRLRRRQGEAHFVVADNGPGISQSNFGRIFEPFFTTKEEEGTGLGLALSKRIVEGHRGRISFRSSVRPGKSGTIFKICLPVQAGQQSS